MIVVDGREVPARGTVLEACRAAGRDVAAFCHDDRLGPGGHCRACLVEVDGALQPACDTPARAGAEVVTESPRLAAYRRDLGELMLSESRPGGSVGRMLARWGATGVRYGLARGGATADRTRPDLRLELDACIRCRLCLRACDREGHFVFAIEGRGDRSRIAWGGQSFAETACVVCGACVAVCPTGAISGRSDSRP